MTETKPDHKAAIEEADANLNAARRRHMEIEAEKEKVEAQLAEIGHRKESLIRESAQGSPEAAKRASADLTAIRAETVEVQMHLGDLQDMIPHAVENVTAKEAALELAKRNANLEKARRLQDDAASKATEIMASRDAFLATVNAQFDRLNEYEKLGGVDIGWVRRERQQLLELCSLNPIKGLSWPHNKSVRYILTERMGELQPGDPVNPDKWLPQRLEAYVLSGRIRVLPLPGSEAAA